MTDSARDAARTNCSYCNNSTSREGGEFNIHGYYFLCNRCIYCIEEYGEQKIVCSECGETTNRPNDPAKFARHVAREHGLELATELGIEAEEIVNLFSTEEEV